MSIEIKTGYLVKTREGNYALAVPINYEGKDMIALSTNAGEFYCPLSAYSKRLNFVRMDDISWRDEDSDIMEVWGVCTNCKHAAITGKESTKYRKLLWKRPADYDAEPDPEDNGRNDGSFLLSLLAAALMSDDD
jgi:hypothetical protein